MKNKIIFLILFLLYPTVVQSSPAISNIIGTMNIGQSLTINGSNFGDTGPNIVIFDEFTGIPGQNVSLAATMGAWTTTTFSPTYISDVGANTAGLLVDGLTSRQMRLIFPSTKEFFVSYKVKIPRGYHFPNATKSGEFAPDSAWKLAWIMDGPDSSPDDDDICLPTFPNGTYFMLAGNDGGIKLAGVTKSPEVGRPNSATNWFSFNGWNRVSTYMKAGADPIADTGVIWFQGLSGEYGAKTFSFLDRTLFDGQDGTGDDAVSEWNYLTMSGWHRTGGINAAYDSTTRAIYDDFYLATGPSAAARVEIGDNAVYANCTKLAIATPNKWGNSSITATIRGGEFARGDSVYVFVVDASNNASAGYGPFVISAPQIFRLE